MSDLGEGLILRREKRNPASERAKAKPKFSRICFIPLYYSLIIVITTNLIVLQSMKTEKDHAALLHHHPPSPTHENIIIRLIYGLCLESRNTTTIIDKQSRKIQQTHDQKPFN